MLDSDEWLNIKLDNKLIRPWGTTREDTPHPPYIAHFKRTKGEQIRELFYITQDHFPPRSIPAIPLYLDLMNHSSIDPFVMAVHYVVAQHPDIMVLEGENARIIRFPDSSGRERFSNDISIDYSRMGFGPLDDLLNTDSIKRSKSAAMAASRQISRDAAINSADAAGIPAVSGEADQRDMIPALEELGYSPYDIMAFYILRCIPQWREQAVQQRRQKNEHTENRLYQSEFEAYVANFLEHSGFVKYIPESIKRLPSDSRELEEWYNKLEEWYDTHPAKDVLGHPKLMLDFSPEDHLAADDSNSYFQKIGKDVQDIREIHLNRVIDWLYHMGFKKVMVDWGGAALLEKL